MSEVATNEVGVSSTEELITLAMDVAISLDAKRPNAVVESNWTDESSCLTCKSQLRSSMSVDSVRVVKAKRRAHDSMCKGCISVECRRSALPLPYPNGLGYLEKGGKMRVAQLRS